jgi:MFS family permease
LSLFHPPYRFYYGWVIVAVSFLTIFFVLGTRSSFGLFYSAILEEYGWGRAETAGAFSLMMIFHALLSPVSGILIDRIGPRKLFPVGGVIVAVGLFLSSFVTKIWHLYLFYGVITAFGINTQSFAPQMSLIPRWFVRKKGLASGLVLSGMGIGTLFMALMIGFIIVRVGWRVAFMTLSAIIFCLVVPMNAIFQRNGPEEVDQTVEETGLILKRNGVSGANNLGQKTETPMTQKVWTFKSALRTRPFWCFLFMGFVQGITVTTMVVHLAPHVIDIGFSPMLAASMVGLVGLLASLGTILFGFLSDRVGRESGYFMASISGFLGILLLILMKDSPLKGWLYAFVILYGLGYGGIAAITAAATGDIFSGRALGRIISTQAVSYGLGSALGVYLGGYFYDKLGSYTIPFSIILLSIIASAIALWLAAPRHSRV